MFIITLGIYSLYWVFKTQDEVKEHSGQGVGGVLGLVIYIVVSAVSAFLVPSEVGKMYKQDGREAPFTGWTGSGSSRASCRPGDRLVRQGPGRAEPLLGEQGSATRPPAPAPAA